MILILIWSKIKIYSDFLTASLSIVHVFAQNVQVKVSRIARLDKVVSLDFFRTF